MTDGSETLGRERPSLRRLAAPAELAVIVPTYNERPNIGPLVARLRAVLEGVAAEIIFVDDDSPDGTAEEIRSLARQDPRLRCLQRIGRRGLASAFIEGALATSAPYIAVLDADLQHDEALLPVMLAKLRQGDADLVVGSRYLDRRDVESWDSRRQRLSHLGTWLGRRLLGVGVTDPMSGFFMLTRRSFDASLRRLSALGFKILLDIIASAPQPLRIVELPYRFRPRRAGVSKLDGQVVQEFALLLADKLLGAWVPARFVLFAAVGSFGVLAHMLMLYLAMHGLGFGFVAAQAIATGTAMTGNYALNNELTYRDRKRRGRRWLTGLVSFSLACAIGAVANVGAAATIYASGVPWPAAALAGITIGAVLNFALTALYTWQASPLAKG